MEPLFPLRDDLCRRSSVGVAGSARQDLEPGRPDEEESMTAMPDSLTACGQAAVKRRINPHRSFVCRLVPNWLLCRKEVSHGAKLTYARRPGRCLLPIPADNRQGNRRRRPERPRLPL